MNTTSDSDSDLRGMQTEEDHFAAFLLRWENSVGNYLKGYILPAGVLFAIVNNLIVILIFGFGSEVKRKVSLQMRIYYIILGIADISTSFPLHATYFAGCAQSS